MKKLLSSKGIFAIRTNFFSKPVLVSLSKEDPTFAKLIIVKHYASKKYLFLFRHSHEILSEGKYIQLNSKYSRTSAEKKLGLDQWAYKLFINLKD